ncbi:MAG: 6-phosphofructokinase [Hyphomicrobiaceae bacterium]
MHIGILTGGGDVPGLNPAIKTVVLEAERRGWRVTGFRRGWAGPLNYDPSRPEASQKHLMSLSPNVVRSIDRTGGTILHSSRTRPSNVRLSDLPHFLSEAKLAEVGSDEVDCTDHVLSVLKALNIDVLIAIGGDDTLSYAARLHHDGMPTVCLPKTIDNDVFGTDYCIGFSTCITRSVDLIHGLRTPAGSHERIMVVELFGRDSGHTALMAGYLADVDRTLIAEVEIDLDKVTKLVVEDRQRNVSNYAIVVVSEGARVRGGQVIEHGEPDAYGHRKRGGIGPIVADYIKRTTKVDVMNQSLGYLVRSGPPDAVDQMVARNFATMAVDCIETGQTGLMMAVQDGIYTTVPADMSTTGERRVDVDRMYDSDAYRPRISGLQGMPMFLK